MQDDQDYKKVFSKEFQEEVEAARKRARLRSVWDEVKSLPVIAATAVGAVAGYAADDVLPVVMGVGVSALILQRRALKRLEQGDDVADLRMTFTEQQGYRVYEEMKEAPQRDEDSPSPEPLSPKDDKPFTP